MQLFHCAQRQSRKAPCLDARRDWEPWKRQSRRSGSEGNLDQRELLAIKKALIILVAAILFLVYGVGAAAVVLIFQMGQESQIPKFEVGPRRGAEFCSRCHQEIYDQWSQRSAHSISTTNASYAAWMEKLDNNYVLNTVFGEKMCIACMGNNQTRVDCEICHGIMPRDASISSAHAKKFTPGRKILGRPDFCPKCHELPPSMTSFADWQKSEAAAKRMTCQRCHMKPDENGVAYHGFDSITRLRSAAIYQDDLVVRDAVYRAPQFSLVVENKIKGHAIPAVGPSRWLVLEISFVDSQDVEQHKVVEVFGKHMSLMPVVGLLPFDMIENTQIQSAEARRLSYELPSSLEGQISKALVTLRFYDVFDWDEGNLDKAHWVSEPIIEEWSEL